MGDFAIGDLSYNIPLSVEIDPDTMTFQILDEDNIAIDQVNLYSISEADFDVMQRQGVPIICLAVLQGLVCALFVAIVERIWPRTVQKRAERRQILQKLKTTIMDL